MRILVVSDLHYSLRQFDWVVAAAPEFDLVVLAGDHLDISSSVSLDAQVVVVLQYQFAQDIGHHRQPWRVTVLMRQVGQVGGHEHQPFSQCDRDERRDRGIALE